jgi:hypothetical protein
VTNFEATLLREVSALPQSRRSDVLAFVRYLRISLMDDEETERRYDTAICMIRNTAISCNITEEDIEEEIRAVRAEYARSA